METSISRGMWFLSEAANSVMQASPLAQKAIVAFEKRNTLPSFKKGHKQWIRTSSGSTILVFLLATFTIVIYVIITFFASTKTHVYPMKNAKKNPF